MTTSTIPIYNNGMNTFFQWTVAIFNPILLVALVPVPLMQFGHLTVVSIFLGFALYAVVWMIIWFKLLDNGRKLTLGEDDDRNK